MMLANEATEKEDTMMVPIIKNWYRPEDDLAMYARLVKLITTEQTNGKACLPHKCLDEIMKKAGITHYYAYDESKWNSEMVKVVFYRGI